MGEHTKEAALADTLVDIARDYFRCVCTEDYTGRGLTDPQCNAHDGVAEDLAKAATALRTPAPGAEPVADALLAACNELMEELADTLSVSVDELSAGTGVGRRAAAAIARASTPIASPADLEATNE